MTIIFSDGFETGDFSEWTGVNSVPLIVTSPVHHGTSAMRINMNLAPVAYKWCYKTLAVSQAVVYHRYYFCTDELPNAENEKIDISRGRVGATDIWQVALAQYAAVGGLCWTFNYRSNTTWTEVRSAATSIGINQWYCVEIYWKKDAAAGEVHLYIDGTEVASVTGKKTDAYGNCDTIRNGVSSYSGVFIGPNIYEDCVCVADAYIGLEVNPIATQIRFH